MGPGASTRERTWGRQEWWRLDSDLELGYFYPQVAQKTLYPKPRSRESIRISVLGSVKSLKGFSRRLLL
jgi:hypothetical protein